MAAISSTLGTLADLLLVVIGFSLIIVVHELGHFLAARWAGVRVMAFAVGFGPALVSYRKGLGIRRGSSQVEYQRKLKADPMLPHSAVSPTEYRLNGLPFGGYVKMLGQDDADPSAHSDEPDSFQTCPVWKRMIIISAGVVMNLILAAGLFVVVFMVGLKTEPPIIGGVVSGRPAATAVAINGRDLGVTQPGLQAGDRVLSVDGETPVKFLDLEHAAAMARHGAPLSLEVKRPGIEEPLRFEIVPQVDPFTKFQAIGVMAASSNKLIEAKSEAERQNFAKIAERIGIPELEPGSRLVELDGRKVQSAHDVIAGIEQSGGKPLGAVFERAGESGGKFEAKLEPQPAMMIARFKLDPEIAAAEHVLGLAPVLSVSNVEENSGGAKAGLRAGDVFSLLGTKEWPSTVDGIQQIRAHKGRTIRVNVVRKGDDGQFAEVDLGDVPVNREGQIGFSFGDSAADGTWVAGWPSLPPDGESTTWSGTTLGLLAGSQIEAVNGQPVSNLHQVRELLAGAVAGPEGGSVELSVRLPGTMQAAPRRETLTWVVPGEEAAELTKLRWQSPIPLMLFEPEFTVLKASGPVEAIGMGLRETRSVMLQTYLTFARLFQGTVKVTHLKGPVGIAHVGTVIASKGWVWLLFFMALISVNLAVINFLPIPIADGGHMVFLIYEQATGKPVSPLVQNIAALVGLVMLASVFLVVTFNDLRTLFMG